MSDPKRTPDLLNLVKYMPSRSAIIYRHFGSPGLEDELRRISWDRNIQLLIGNDPELALSCEADGVHFSRRASTETLATWRNAQPNWIITTAWSKTKSDPRTFEQLDGVFVSSVFQSDSTSAGTPIGVRALREFTKQCSYPVFALGGITDETAPNLVGTGIGGIASIGGLAEILRKVMAHPIHAQPDAAVSISKEDNGDNIRFIARIKNETAQGELTLKRISDTVWNANHTGVPATIGGKGVGTALVLAMVEDARQQGYQIVPRCPFIAKLFNRHPDWATGIVA